MAGRARHGSVVAVLDEVEAQSSEELPLLRELEPLWVVRPTETILLKRLGIDRALWSLELLVVALARHVHILRWSHAISSQSLSFFSPASHLA